tara:strand:- start:499 stop:645 length:147 start_codon:yes stop_codon:yes gene_type:complete
MRHKSPLEKKLRYTAKGALEAGLTLAVLGLLAWESFMHARRTRHVDDE